MGPQDKVRTSERGGKSFSRCFFLGLTLVQPLPQLGEPGSARGSEHKGEEDTALDIKGPEAFWWQKPYPTLGVFIFSKKRQHVLAPQWRNPALQWVWSIFPLCLRQCTYQPKPSHPAGDGLPLESVSLRCFLLILKGESHFLWRTLKLPPKQKSSWVPAGSLGKVILFISSSSILILCVKMDSEACDNECIWNYNLKYLTE